MRGLPKARRRPPSIRNTGYLSHVESRRKRSTSSLCAATCGRNMADNSDISFLCVCVFGMSRPREADLAPSRSGDLEPAIMGSGDTQSLE